jgi:hypothetical protein
MADLGFGLTQSYYHYSRLGNVYSAYASAITPVVYTATAAQTLLLYNGTTNLEGIILGVTCAATVGATTACALGLTGGSQSAGIAIAAQTAITLSGSLRAGGQSAGLSVYKIGTVSTAGTFFMPLFDVGTVAITSSGESLGYVDIAGAIVVPPNSWVAIASSASADASLVCQAGLVWAETPVR